MNADPLFKIADRIDRAADRLRFAGQIADAEACSNAASRIRAGMSIEQARAIEAQLLPGVSTAVRTRLSALSGSGEYDGPGGESAQPGAGPAGAGPADAEASQPGGVDNTSFSSLTLLQAPGAFLGKEIFQNLQYAAALSQASDVDAYTGSPYPVSPLLADPYPGGPSPYFPGGQPVNAYNGGRRTGGAARPSPTGNIAGSGGASGLTGSSVEGIPTSTGSGSAGGPTGTGGATDANGVPTGTDPYNGGKQSGGNSGFNWRQDSATVPFYFPTEKGDIFAPTGYRDTGNTFLNYIENLYFGLDNLAAFILHIPGWGLRGLQQATDAAARALGLNELDMQAIRDLSAAGEFEYGVRAASMAIDEVFGRLFLRGPNTAEEISGELAGAAPVGGRQGAALPPQLPAGPPPPVQLPAGPPPPLQLPAGPPPPLLLNKAFLNLGPEGVATIPASPLEWDAMDAARLERLSGGTAEEAGNVGHAVLGAAGPGEGVDFRYPGGFIREVGFTGSWFGVPDVTVWSKSNQVQGYLTAGQGDSGVVEIYNYMFGLVIRWGVQ
jgi:hypothetical protein